MSYSNVGKVWTPKSIGDYLKNLKKPSWAKGVCIHHTAFPDLAMRPKGLLASHIENIRYGYVNDKKWSAGPHFFTDEDQVWGMTPPSEKGVHAVGFNSSHIGIEALGDFDREDPASGRGLEVMLTTAAATKQILDWLGLPVNEKTVVFHREDGYTNKTCPGRKITKEWFLGLVRSGPALTPVAPMVSPKPAKSEMVKVADYLRQNKVSEADITKGLVKKGGLFLFEGHWLEGAYYDSVAGATVAPRSEIDEAIGARLG